MTTIFGYLGKLFFLFIQMLGNLGKFTIYQMQMIKLSLSPPFRMKEIFEQMVIVGVGSIGVIALTGIFTGMVSSVQLYQGFHQFGAENLMGFPIFISITRELGPVFSGLMLTSRAISAIAAELGSMRVTEQIDALDTLAVDSRKYLLVPRIIATTISLPILVILFDFLGNISAYFTSVYMLGVNPSEYLNTINIYISLSDIFTGIAKGLIFGFYVGSIGTYIGYNTRGGARGVGRATTQAVVNSAVIVFVLDYFIAAIFLILGW
ncbi:MAG: ABC transporter permease [Sulfurospirillum sp.]|nr:MAG: ABC transporter permease [Sulfurospirillum sp.]